MIIDNATGLRKVLKMLWTSVLFLFEYRGIRKCPTYVGSGSANDIAMLEQNSSATSQKTRRVASGNMKKLEVRWTAEPTKDLSSARYPSMWTVTSSHCRLSTSSSCQFTAQGARFSEAASCDVGAKQIGRTAGAASAVCVALVALAAPGGAGRTVGKAEAAVDAGAVPCKSRQMMFLHLTSYPSSQRAAPEI